MKKYSLFFISIGVLMFLSTVFAGEEATIPLHKVPAELLQHAESLFPEARYKTANIEQEDDGKKVYEIQGVLADGHKIEVDIWENGSIEEYEIEFTREQVPGAVLKAIEKKLPGFQPEFIEASHSASGKVVKYEFVGKLGDETLDIEVSADGRKIEVSDQ